jgi:glycosyltransferase involved in cell wall biosynthesis
MLAALQRLSFRQIAVSEAVAGLFAHRSSVSVIENPVPMELFGMPFSSSGDQRPLRVLTLGRISPRKELELVVEIAARVTAPTLFDIVGPVGATDHAYREQLARLATHRQVNGRVSILPPRPVAEALRGADVLLHTGGSEGFCRVVAEAMAAGRPVVAPSSGATGGLVEDRRTGLLFDTVEQAMRAIDALAASPRLRTALGNEARRTAKARFSTDTAARAVLGIYHSSRGAITQGAG